MKFAKFCLLIIIHLYLHSSQCVALDEQQLDLRIVTVATKMNDKLNRLIENAEQFNIDIEVVGLGMGYDGSCEPGGFEVDLFKTAIEQWKDADNVLVMFVNSFDSMIVADSKTIIKKFLDFDSSIVFSTEISCQPDPKLMSSYPKVTLGNRFLNSGGLIGYAPVLYSLINDNELSNPDNDQLYYTKLFIQEEKRMKYGIRLDSRSHIFQHLDGAVDSLIEVVYNNSETYATNKKYTTIPAVYHSNEKSRAFISYLSNYVPNQWNHLSGCLHCQNNVISLPMEEVNWPTILIALFVKVPTPFFDIVLKKLEQLNYPKQLISIWIHNQTPYHDKMITEWVDSITGDYCNVQFVSSEVAMAETEALEKAMDTCVSIGDDCDYYFYIDSTIVLDEPNTLKRLIILNKNVISPLLTHPTNVLNSNFWGKYDNNGYYTRSRDYGKIVNREFIGVWNVPLIFSAILFKGAWLKNLSNDLPQYHSKNPNFDSDKNFGKWMRDKGHFMYVSNLHQHYGHLLSTNNYETHHFHNDLYNIFENVLDWEQKYLHESFSTVFKEGYQFNEPCNDVYQFPMVSPSFAKEMIEELENYGQWSGGTNADTRIPGGYEAVPTRDVHMNQIGFEQHWLQILRYYIIPIQRMVFSGYTSEGRALLNFVVKYHPNGQASLKPHNDESTFTVNIALSRYGIDHEGGGCRFIRRNCSVVDTQLGWGMMHPGRFTHQHEGLTTTKGTRYIMVTFVDP